MQEALWNLPSQQSAKALVEDSFFIDMSMMGVVKVHFYIRKAREKSDTSSPER
jgi:hypothetical protein